MASLGGGAAGRLVSAFGRGYEAAVAPFDEPGPVAKVSPFEAGTVTPGAIALKSLAALTAGHRALANSRQKATEDADQKRYHDLLRIQLERKLAAPTPENEVVRPVKGPDGTVFHLTDPQRVAHLTQLSPAAEKPVPPSKRVHMEPARARSLGIPWDEATRTVAFDDYGPNAGARAAEALFEQRAKNNERAGTREDRADTASRIARAEDTLGKLKKSEEQYAESGAVRSRAQYDNAGRILLSPDASPKIKARFAQMLGVRGAMTKPETDAKGQPMGASVEIKDANGSPVYDPGDISAAIERKTKAAQAWHLNRIRQQNKAERAFQEDTQRRSGAILANDGMAPDEAPDPLDEYRALRASWGAAESDTAAGGIDQKAY